MLKFRDSNGFGDTATSTTGRFTPRAPSSAQRAAPPAATSTQSWRSSQLVRVGKDEQEKPGKNSMGSSYGGSFNLPDIKGEQPRQATLRRSQPSAENANDKGGALLSSGLMLQLADKLWKIGEEQKGQPDDDVPDERVRPIRDELLDVAETLAPSDTAKAKAMRKEMNATDESIRLRRMLTDRDGQVVALENTFLMYVSQREKAKARNIWLRTYALDARFTLGDTACASMVFNGWQTAIAKMHYEREAEAITLKLRADGFSSKAETMMRAMGMKGAAVQAMCFNGWAKAMRASVMRKRALGSLTRQLEVNDFAVVSHFAALWQTSARLEQASRTLKVVREEAEEYKEATTDEMKKIVLRFGEQAMATLKRRINANEATIIADSMSRWVLITAESKTERKLEEERERSALAAMAAAMQARAAAIEVALSGSGTKLVKDAFCSWAEGTKAAAMQRQLKDKAMASTLRGISGANAAVQEAVALAWLRVAVDGRTVRALEDANRKYMELLLKTQQDKLKAVSMGFGKQDRDLMAKTLESWGKAIVLEMQNAATKEERMQKAARMISSSNELLVRTVWSGLAWRIIQRQQKGNNMNKALRILGASETALKKEVFGLWFSDVLENRNLRILSEQERISREGADRARQQKMAAIDKCFGANKLALALQCFERWSQEVAAQNLKRKRSDQSMAVAMRAIGKQAAGIMLEVVSAWCSFTKEEFMLHRLDSANAQFLAQLGTAQAQYTIMENARKRAIAIFEKSINGNIQALLQAAVVGWFDEIEREKKRELKRAQITTNVMRNINGGEEVMKLVCFSTWQQLTEVNRDLGVERRRLKRVSDLGRTVVLRLRERLILRLAFVWWYVRAM